MHNELIHKVDIEIALIGKKLLQNKKFDFQNSIEYGRFVQLLNFKKLLVKFCIPNTLDLSQLSFDTTTILNTIKTFTYSK